MTNPVFVDPPPRTRDTETMTAAEGAEIVFRLVTSPLVADLHESDDRIGAVLRRAKERLSLSSGEVVLIDAALAVWNCSGGVKLADIGRLDARCQQVVLTVWLLVYGDVGELQASTLRNRLRQLAVDC